MNVEAVLFDLDDTLMFEMASEREAFQVACNLAHDRCDVDAAALYASVRREAAALWRAAPTHAYCSAMGISSWEGLWGRFVGDDPNLNTLRDWAPYYQREAWLRGLNAEGVDDPALAEELGVVYRRERRKRHLLFPETRTMIAELRAAGLKLGILTNGAPDIQRDKIEGAAIGHLFDVIVVSAELAIGKPDPRIFQMAMERLGASAEQTVMVGDSLERDIVGARAAGLRSVWVDLGHTPDRKGIEPDATIHTLDELPDVLRQL